MKYWAVKGRGRGRKRQRDRERDGQGWIITFEQKFKKVS